MSQDEFVAFVDESGDEGFSFEAGSSKWFVLSAVVVRKTNEIQTVKLVDGVREILRRPPKSKLHFRDLKHEQRLPYVEALAKAPVRLINILVYKPSLPEPEKYRRSSLLYFYCVRLLVERLSWLCRDAKKQGTGRARMVFSNRSGLSYDSMRSYIQKLKDMSGQEDIRIDWNFIDSDAIESRGPLSTMGLLLADACASSAYFAVTPKYGICEPRYIQMLSSRLYRVGGQVVGYGMKIWPREIWNQEGPEELTSLWPVLK